MYSFTVFGCIISRNVSENLKSLFVLLSMVKLQINCSYLKGMSSGRVEESWSDHITLRDESCSRYLLIFNYSMSRTILASINGSSEAELGVKQEQMRALGCTL